MEDGWGSTMAEFQCTRRGGTVELELKNDPRRKSLSGMQRKWKVAKIFLDNEGKIIVNRWAVNSTITYTGDEGMHEIIITNNLTYCVCLYS